MILKNRKNRLNDNLNDMGQIKINGKPYTGNTLKVYKDKGKFSIEGQDVTPTDEYINIEAWGDVTLVVIGDDIESTKIVVGAINFLSESITFIYRT